MRAGSQQCTKKGTAGQPTANAGALVPDAMLEDARYGYDGYYETERVSVILRRL